MLIKEIKKKDEKREKYKNHLKLNLNKSQSQQKLRWNLTRLEVFGRMLPT